VCVCVCVCMVCGVCSAWRVCGVSVRMSMYCACGV
jgi:hypothetical protein